MLVLRLSGVRRPRGLFAVAVMAPTAPASSQPDPLVLVWSSLPNGLRSRPRFQALPAEQLLRQLLQGPFFSWDSWVVLVVTQAGQLEGIQRGITSTSPPAPHLSAAVVVLPIDGWTWSGGVGLLIREGSVREPKGATAASPTVALAALSPPRMLLLLFESRMCAFLSE